GAGDETSHSWSALLFRARRFTSRLLDGLADAGIRAAAADVAREGVCEVGVRGRRDLREQRRGRHDLAGLTVAALNDLEIQPGLLHGLTDRGLSDRLDRRDRMPGGGAHR